MVQEPSFCRKTQEPSPFGSEEHKKNRPRCVVAPKNTKRTVPVVSMAPKNTKRTVPVVSKKNRPRCVPVVSSRPLLSSCGE